MTETPPQPPTAGERFRERFPLFAMSPPSADEMVAHIEAEREQAGTEGIILGASYERNTLFEIISKTDAVGSPAKFKKQLLAYLTKEEPHVAP